MSGGRIEFTFCPYISFIFPGGFDGISGTPMENILVILYPVKNYLDLFTCHHGLDVRLYLFGSKGF